jgi:GntR family transcriptional regulator
MKDDPIRDDRRPLYERAQSAIITRIMEGLYKPGDQLPPEDQLAAGLGISRTTIRSALGNLETLGYIQRIHGAGTFVTQRHFQVEAQLDALESFHPRLAARMGRSSRIVHLEIQETPADPETASAMGLRAGDCVIRISRSVEIDAVPVVYLEDFLPKSVVTVEALRATFCDSVVDYFAGQEGRPTIAWSDSNLGAARADEALAALLHVGKGATLFRLDEGFYTANAMLVSWSRNFIVPEYFRFYIRRRVVHGDIASSPEPEAQSQVRAAS